MNCKFHAFTIFWIDKFANDAKTKITLFTRLVFISSKCFIANDHILT